mmetsp:Transcript_5925/g.8647  ORF Transcript_5925/g.8647 Transcript_5925/m.8647 type:complete len:313 (+) Transcript_5925:182-1120(+)|eukprot:CAMPEP_0196810646 /NCGR_PEP_ID=MMETSP1362-20130617/12918_1 /TAXON_ID=163516 /ORGANISM="Leptocylindrus danicus, Strain CCMP1856" /LENGTH=312 /DNA_ID=CAMNT_0042185741 /DNA_START=177 /DNA_END=1115 /DNA_ORIENTATION=+
MNDDHIHRDDITTTFPEANSNNNNNNTSWISEAVTRPTHNDVLFGRGGGVNRHVGNIHFRQLVSKYEHDYRATHRKADKTDISARIVSIIRTLDPPGRFLKNTEGVWRDVGDEKARNKTSQALRERGPSNGVNNNSSSGKTGSGRAIFTTAPNDDSTDTNTLKPRRNRKAMLLRVKCKLDRASLTWSCINIRRGSKTNKRCNSKKQIINRVGVDDEQQKQMDTVLDTPIEIEDIACHEKMPSCSTNEHHDGVFRTTAFTSNNAGTKLVRKVTDPALYNSSTDGTASTSSSSASLGSLQDDGVQALLQLANVC